MPTSKVSKAIRNITVLTAGLGLLVCLVAAYTLDPKVGLIFASIPIIVLLAFIVFIQKFYDPQSDDSGKIIGLVFMIFICAAIILIVAASALFAYPRPFARLLEPLVTSVPEPTPLPTPTPLPAPTTLPTQKPEPGLIPDQGNNMPSPEAGATPSVSPRSTPSASLSPKSSPSPSPSPEARATAPSIVTATPEPPESENSPRTYRSMSITGLVIFAGLFLILFMIWKFDWRDLHENIKVLNLLLSAVVSIFSFFLFSGIIFNGTWVGFIISIAVGGVLYLSMKRSIFPH